AVDQFQAVLGEHLAKALGGVRIIRPCSGAGAAKHADSFYQPSLLLVAARLRDMTSLCAPASTPRPRHLDWAVARARAPSTVPAGGPRAWQSAGRRAPIRFQNRGRPRARAIAWFADNRPERRRTRRTRT